MTTVPIDAAVGPFPTERARPASVPSPAPGLTLLGTPQGAHDEPHGMVRRADGQVLQLTPLLYAVLAELVDTGQRTDTVALAERVHRRTGRELAAEDVEFLVEERLTPLGVLADVGPERPVRAAPLLGLRLRWEVSEPERTRRITRPFAALFHPVIVTAVLAAFGTAAVWMLFNSGLAMAARHAVYEPLWLLALLGLTLLSAGFHEFGHAAACRRAGATPGAMGMGLYLLSPAFYTDVTDAYRLDRRGRLLVDLGGLYFNCVFAVAGILAWGLTGVDALLLIYPIQLLQVARQLLPFLRYDGYHVLADATGVPDLFTQIRPTLATLLPRNWGRPSPSRLRPRARALVLIWTVVTVPLLAGGFLLLLSTLPALLATTADSLLLHRDALVVAARTTDVPLLLLRLVQVLVLAIAPLSIAYLGWRIGRRSLRAVWARTAGSVAGRAAVVTGVVGLLALVGWILLPDDDWQPIADTSTERAAPKTTATKQVTAASASPSRAALQAAPETAQPPGSADLASVDGLAFDATAPTDATDAGATTGPAPTAPGPVGTGPAPTVPPSEPSADTAPAADTSTEPQDSAATPRDQWVEVYELPTSWAWSWPRPAPPREHDNVAVAAVDRDATWMRAFTTEFLVAPDGTVDHRNAAHAYAMCTDCGAVAASFQVVVLPGEHRVVVPQNVAVAANEDCTRCVVNAVASQLVVSTTEVPDATVRAELEAVLAELAPLREQLDVLTPSDVHAAFQDAQRQVLAILAAAEPTGDTPAFSTDASVADGEATQTHTTTPTEGPTTTVEPTTEGATDGTSTDSTGADDPATGGTSTDGTTTDGTSTDGTSTGATSGADGTDETTTTDGLSDGTLDGAATTDGTTTDGTTTDTADSLTGDDGSTQDTTATDGSSTEDVTTADTAVTDQDTTATTTDVDTTDATVDTTTEDGGTDEPTGTTTTATTTTVATRDDEW